VADVHLDTPHRIGPGTIKDVPVTLLPTAAAPTNGASLGAASIKAASLGAASFGAASPGAVDNAASSSAESATLPLRGAETRPAAMKAAPGAGDAVGAGSVKAAPAAGGGASGAGSVKAAPAAGAQLLSTPVSVGKARFVGVSWPVPAVGPQADMAGKVWLRARTDAGWSGWRAVEPAADGPDANTSEYRRSERAYSDGLWLDSGTAEVQVRVDQPAPPVARCRRPGCRRT
jgi:hypothetical protein